MKRKKIKKNDNETESWRKEEEKWGRRKWKGRVERKRKRRKKLKKREKKEKDNKRESRWK